MKKNLINLKNCQKKSFFSKFEINKIIKKLDIKTKNSIDIAFKRIYIFHKNQKFKILKF